MYHHLILCSHPLKRR